MTETVKKNGIANFFDKIADGVKEKNSGTDDLNVLPLPNNQLIGDGMLVWQWYCLYGQAMIEAVYTIRDGNPMGLPADDYLVVLKMPESENYSYMFNKDTDDTCKEIGQALISAWNWKNVWKDHAGELLFKAMQQAPVATPAPDELTEEFIEVTEPGQEPELIDPHGPEVFDQNGSEVL